MGWAFESSLNSQSLGKRNASPTLQWLHFKFSGTCWFPSEGPRDMNLLPRAQTRAYLPPSTHELILDSDHRD